MSRESFVTSLFDKDYAPAERFKYDLSLAENPFGASPNVQETIMCNLHGLYHYPNKENFALKTAISNFYGIAPQKLCTSSEYFGQRA